MLVKQGISKNRESEKITFKINFVKNRKIQQESIMFKQKIILPKMLKNLCIDLKQLMVIKDLSFNSLRQKW